MGEGTRTLERARPRILLSLGGGGYGHQAKLLAVHLAPYADLMYITTVGARQPGRHGVPDGPCLVVPHSRGVTRGTRFTTALAVLVVLAKAPLFLARHRPDCVVGVAMPTSLVLLFVARLMGVRTVFVESLTRVRTPSVTLRWCRRLRLAEHLLVQWPSLVASVPGTRYEGRVF